MGWASAWCQSHLLLLGAAQQQLSPQRTVQHPASCLPGPDDDALTTPIPCGRPTLGRECVARQHAAVVPVMPPLCYCCQRSAAAVAAAASAASVTPAYCTEKGLPVAPAQAPRALLHGAAASHTEMPAGTLVRSSEADRSSAEQDVGCWGETQQEGYGVCACVCRAGRIRTCVGVDGAHVGLSRHRNTNSHEWQRQKREGRQS